jgi:molybdopterin/thiamine biosynthesis adenylyltransferase
MPTRETLFTLLSRPSQFANENGELAIGEFEPATIPSPTSMYTTKTLALANNSILSKSKVLVVGAGGLGCEILKDLSMLSI